jgi:purine-cytosine permease-like protein
VPPEGRTLSALDVGILWNDLSLGLLVLVTGALLVPALGLPAAIGAIVVGSLIGCVPLAAAALAGAREGLPGIVLFRPVLGRTGSCLPSALNVAQLLGWTSVEFWAMGRLANHPFDRAVQLTNVGFPFPLMGSRLGASVPSFAVAFVLSLLLLPRRRTPVVGEPLRR